MSQDEEDALTSDEVDSIKSDMVDLAARLERLAVRLQAPARMTLPAEDPERGRRRGKGR